MRAPHWYAVAVPTVMLLPVAVTVDVPHDPRAVPYVTTGAGDCVSVAKLTSIDDADASVRYGVRSRRGPAADAGAAARPRSATNVVVATTTPSARRLRAGLDPCLTLVPPSPVVPSPTPMSRATARDHLPAPR